MAQDIDKTVLEQARSGDKQAFDCIQQHYEAMAQRFVWRLIGQPIIIDDIVQTAFLALWRNIERIESISHLRGFLFRVLRNQTYDILRKQRRFDKVALEAVQPMVLWLEAGDASPEEQLHWTLVYSQVQNAIDKLPEQQRQTLIMSYLFDLTHAEIAEAMDISIGTVKSRLFNARKQLARLLPPDIIHIMKN